MSRVQRARERRTRSRGGASQRRCAAEDDKKARAGRVPFVLPTAVGRVVVRDDVTRAEITRALRVMAGREALLA